MFASGPSHNHPHTSIVQFLTQQQTPKTRNKKTTQNQKKSSSTSKSHQSIHFPKKTNQQKGTSKATSPFPPKKTNQQKGVVFSFKGALRDLQRLHLSFGLPGDGSPAHGPFRFLHHAKRGGQRRGENGGGVLQGLLFVR